MNTLPNHIQKVFVEATYFSCNRRKLDAQKLQNYFEINGYEMVNSPEAADIILLVTCAVSLNRENESICRVSDLKKFQGDLIVCGCLPGINKQRLELAHDGKSIPTSDLSTIDAYFPTMRFKFADLEDANAYYPTYRKIFDYDFIQAMSGKFQSVKNLSFKYIITKKLPGFVKNLYNRQSTAAEVFPIRISWGCDRNCSYCGIRSAVGRFHSKPLEICHAEFMKGLSSGYKKFEIIADNVGAYGADIGSTFPDLINLFLEAQEDYSIQIWNLSPSFLLKYRHDFAAILQTGKISGIHFPVQSGSDRILKSMHRYSNHSKVAELLIWLKDEFPNLNLTTDIILGFPGEKEEDVEKTIDLIRKAYFKMVDIFIYYDAPRTPASTLSDKVPHKVINQRLRHVAKALEDMDIAYQVS